LTKHEVVATSLRWSTGTLILQEPDQSLGDQKAVWYHFGGAIPIHLELTKYNKYNHKMKKDRDERLSRSVADYMRQ
jgi:hypothetical protein